MNTSQRTVVGGTLALVTLGLTVMLANYSTSHAQVGGGSKTGSSVSPADMDAERAAIWNSPNMLRARAWLQDYCSKSAKVSPTEGQKYMTELQNLSPTQMKLWLMKFDEEEANKQQQQSLWQQAHQAGLSRAMAANRATQQSYTAIESEETAAATQEQQQLNEQQAAEQNLQADNQIEEGAYGPGADGVHYHFHLYPY